MLINCEICDKEFKRTPWKIKNRKHNFCSKSCHSLYVDITDNSSNKDTTGICCFCNSTFEVKKPCYLKARKYCSLDCSHKASVGHKVIKTTHNYTWLNYTIATIKSGCDNIYSAHAKIRGYSKAVLGRSDLSLSCKNCSYDKHVEVCHIKSISSFEDTATMAEVNDVSNLVYLCPNCHWEFDHNLIK